MRKNIFLLAVLPVFLITLFACTKSPSGSNSGTNSTPASGTWKVTYFFDKKEETSYFSGYTFDFETSGTLKAHNGSQTWTGSWQSGYDDSTDKLLMNFNTGGSGVLSELEEDWRIIKIEDNFMHLEHTSGGNGDTDIVKFSKI